MEYVVNNYRKKNFGNKVLLTTDHGTWILLNKDEYYNFRLKKINLKLFKKLEKKGIILTDKNKENIISLLRRKKTFLFRGPSLHIVVPTLRCNLKCIYCHASAKSINSEGYDMDINTAKKVVDFIWEIPANDIMIEFQGGEPLLNFKVVKFIIEYSEKKKETQKKKKKKVTYTIVTNLILLNNEIIDFVKANNIRICTSLDGPALVHEKNRGSHFNKLKENILKLREKRIKVLNALMVTTKYSLKYWKEIINEYIRLGFDQVWIKPINKLGYSKENWEKIGYSSEEYLEFWKKCLDYIIKLNKNGFGIREVSGMIMVKKFLEEEDPGFTDLQSPCGGIIGQIAYNHDGNIYTCDEARMSADKYDTFKIGNVKKDDFKSVISSTTACNFINCANNENVAVCLNCVWKPFCGICPVVNYENEGKMIFSNKNNFRCRVLDGQFEFLIKKLNGEDAKVLKKWLQ